MIDRASVSHLGREQQAKLLAVAKLLSVFERGPVCYLDISGVTGVKACLMPLVPSYGSGCLRARRVRERLKLFGSDVVVHYRQRMEWKKQKWKDQCSNGLSLSCALSVVVCCVLYLDWILCDVLCIARVVRDARSI